MVATNPLFPLKAIHHRLAWAGLSAEEIPYKLVACYETFHFAKPNPGYYKEILAKVDANPDECVMVGNDLENDIQPAESIGIHTFRIITAPGEAGPKNGYELGLQDQVISWIKSLDL